MPASLLVRQRRPADRTDYSFSDEYEQLNLPVPRGRLLPEPGRLGSPAMTVDHAELLGELRRSHDRLAGTLAGLTDYQARPPSSCPAGAAGTSPPTCAAMPTRSAGSPWAC